MRFFVSYRRTAADYAHAIASALAQAFPGALVYMDTNSGSPGENFALRIRKEILLADLVLVVTSPQLFASAKEDARHDHVVDEIETAQRLGVPILPVLERPEDFPGTATVPSRIEAFARVNATVTPRRPDGTVAVDTLAAGVTAAVPRHRRSRLTKRGRAASLLQWAADVLLSPSRWSVAGATANSQAWIRGAVLLASAPLISWLMAAFLLNEPAQAIMDGVLQSSALLSALAALLVLISSAGWWMVGRRPELALIFLSTSAVLFALWGAFLIQSGFELIAFVISDIDLGVLSEVLRMEDPDYPAFVEMLAESLTPEAYAVMAASKLMLLFLVVYYTRDYLRFQSVIHLAGQAMAWKWRAAFLVLGIGTALLAFTLPSAAEGGRFECRPNDLGASRNNLCLINLYTSQDPKHPGEIEVRAFGTLSHNLRELVLSISALEIRSSADSAGGLIRVKRVDAAFAPFDRQAGKEVVYRWKQKEALGGSMPIDVRLTGDPVQRAELNETLRLTLPTNYAEGEKRLMFHTWFDFHHPSGGTSSFAMRSYCTYSSGSCLTN